MHDARRSDVREPLSVSAQKRPLAGPVAVLVLLMVGYAAHRFLNEAIRIEPSYSIAGSDYGLTLSQWISVLIFILAVGMELYLRATRPKLPPGAVPLGYKKPT